MIMLTSQDMTITRVPLNRITSGVLWSLLCGFLLMSSPLLVAQVEEPADQLEPQSEQAPDAEIVEIEEIVVSLPNSQQMAMAVATPGMRQQALLDMAVAARLVSHAENTQKPANEIDQSALAQQFLDDRAWLQTLVDRYGWAEPRSSVVDPAAWRLLKELQQYDLHGMPLSIPGSMPKEVLQEQVFRRSGQPLAVANLPVLLLEVESQAFMIWDAFLQMIEVEGSPVAAWKPVETAWFTNRQFQLAMAADSPAEEQDELIVDIPQAMSEIVLSAVDVRPPDGRTLKQLRYEIMNRVTAETETEVAFPIDQARDLLYILSLVDGLHEGRYFDFVQGLIAVTFRLLESPGADPWLVSLVDWLVTELPAISASYAANFASVDPYLNSVIATSYNVLVTIAGFRASEELKQELAQEATVENSGESNTVQETDDYSVEIKSSEAALADSVAQLGLLIPDMAYYFETPVRARIVREVNSCISMAAELDDNGAASMTRRQFDNCMQTLLELADREARLAELSGDMNGPFATETLRRELSVAPWQRINYAIGFIDDHITSQCLPPANVLPNPLEWAALANSMSWFAERFPEFFDSTENENRISRMRGIGEEIVQAMRELSTCLAASGTGINGLVSRVMTEYEMALRELNFGIRKAEQDFRTQKLKTGADVTLAKDASQKTSFRPNDLVITPCDSRAVCEMSGNLSTTRALIGLFPDEYLVSDQTGMGRIEICYRNMEWVNRRSELVRPDDENVANYFGYLGFDLVGRYVENNESTDIFGFRFTAPDEHHYLFAQASEEVLNDSCPVEWVGSRTITPLREDRGGMVPDRLTYLAASRKLPSRLLQSNWDRGAEWRDWFVTGIGVSPLELPDSPDIKTRLNQHLQSLYQAEQMEIYQRILLPNARDSKGEVVSLFTEMSEVSISKAILRMQMMLFYPESVIHNDSIRRAIAGDAGLLEQRTLRRFKGENVPLTSVSRIARERLSKFSEEWLNQPEALRRQGSLPPSLVYALTRINTLYRQFFIARPEVLLEVETTVPEELPLQPET